MTARKTLAETKAEYMSLGYGEALEVVVTMWRERIWSIGVERSKTDPISIALWQLIEPMNKRSSELDDEYKRLMLPRVYPERYPNGWNPPRREP